MKAIILVAGYATRLYPLTKNRAKALLPVGGKPILEHIIEKINTLDEVDEIIVVSNHQFYEQFLDWKETTSARVPVRILDDGTVDDTTKLGAIGDIQFAIDTCKVDDDLLVLAGDNLFTYALQDYVQFFHEKQSDCVCVKQWEHKEELSRFAIAILDADGRVLDIAEKPSEPKSNTVVFATYLYRKETVPMVREYLEAGNNPDAPGHFPVWLYSRKPVYAYAFSGTCYDIGTPESYEEVCGLMQALDE